MVIQMKEPRLANSGDAPQLVELYCKALKAAGMDKKRCAQENRAEFIHWLKTQCTNDKFWILEDANGPSALVHYVPEETKIITVVVRDDIANRGVATRIIKFFQKKEDFLKAIPVSRNGKALLKKCGFIEDDRNTPYWCWSGVSLNPHSKSH